MERNSNHELARLFCKIGGTLSEKELDRNRVCDMFNAVFNYFGEGDASTSTWSSVVINPAIIALRAEFKRHVRRNTWAYLSPLKLALAVQEAETECRKMIDLFCKFSEDEDLVGKLGKEKLQQEMKEESGWFEKANEWRREICLEEHFQSAVKSFKSRLSSETTCCVDELTSSVSDANQVRHDVDIRAVGKTLMREILSDVASEFPSFEDQAGARHWLDGLHQELAQILTEAFQKSAERSISLVVAGGYKVEMEKFLREHLFAKKEAVEDFRLQLQTKYEQVQVDRGGLAQILNDPDVKSMWDAWISEENARLETSWRAEQQAAIAAFQMGLKTLAQKIAGQEHNIQLEETELEALLATDFPRVLRRLMEKAEESKTLGECLYGGDSAEDDKEKMDEDQTEPAGGDPLERIDVGDQLEEGTNNKSGDVSLKVVDVDPQKKNANAADRDMSSSANRNATLLASIWIHFRNLGRDRHQIIFPKGTTFPTPTPTTKELSVYFGKNYTTPPASITFCETESGRSEPLGRLELEADAIAAPADKWGGVANTVIALTCHIDSSGMFHAEAAAAAAGSNSSGKRRFKTFKAPTCTSWSSERRSSSSGDGGGDHLAPSPGRASSATDDNQKKKRRSSGGSSSTSSTRSNITSSHKRKK